MGRRSTPARQLLRVWRRRKEKKRKSFGQGEHQTFPKRSSLAGTTDEVRPHSAPWLTTTRN
jgi:hypothetical protein